MSNWTYGNKTPVVEYWKHNQEKCILALRRKTFRLEGWLGKTTTVDSFDLETSSLGDAIKKADHIIGKIQSIPFKTCAEKNEMTVEYCFFKVGKYPELVYKIFNPSREDGNTYIILVQDNPAGIATQGDLLYILRNEPLQAVSWTQAAFEV